MAESVRFYRDVLGLPLEFESPHWTQFALGSIKLGLHPPLVAGPTHAGIILGIQVDDLDALRVALTAAGSRMDAEYHETPNGMTLTFEDPHGNWIQAIQRRDDTA